MSQALDFVAPRVGLEPTTNGLTVAFSPSRAGRNNTEGEENQGLTATQVLLNRTRFWRRIRFPLDGLSRSAGAVLLASLLTGCATCERHPAACTAAVAVIGTSIALSVRHHDSAPSKPLCQDNPAFPNGCHPIG